MGATNQVVTWARPWSPGSSTRNVGSRTGLHKCRNFLGTSWRVSHSNLRLGGGKQSKIYTSWFCWCILFKIHTMFQGFAWVFRVAPIGWDHEHCFWRWSLVHICSQLKAPFSEFLVLYWVLGGVRLLCLVHLWLNECVGGSRISFEAPGISF